MDKRALLFAIALSTSFFGVQAWFDSKKAKAKETSLVTAHEEQTKRQNDLDIEIGRRTSSIDQLPIAHLFTDATGATEITAGVRVGDLFLTLGWHQNPPKELFVSEKNTFIPIQLATEYNGPKSPVVYSLPQASAVHLPAIPYDRPSDLQLVTMNQELRVVLGEQRGDCFSIPYHFLDESAIAFVQEKNQFLPVGIFDPESKKVRAIHDFQKLSVLVKQDMAPAAKPMNNGEEFYVLENEFQQLVFSTRGGALSEINLPFKTEENQHSLVKEIDFDRDILEDSPQNAHFPLFPYTGFSDGKKVSNDETALGGYYPLLRRPIIGSDGVQKTQVPAQFYAFNVVGDDPEIAKMNYQVTRFEPNLIQFEAKSSQRRIVKTFFIPKERNGPYCLQMDMQIDGDANNLWLTSGVPDVELLGGSYSPLLRMQTLKNSTSDVTTLSLPKKDSVEKLSADANWISNSNGFLGVIQDPLISLNPGAKATQISGTELPTRLTLIDSTYNLYPAQNYPGYTTFLPLKGGTDLSFRIFAGPYDESLLKQLDGLYENPITHYNPDYTAAQSIQGWFSFISEPFAQFLFFLMGLFHSATGSWALAIVLLTIALKAMMYPLNAWSIKSSIKMQAAAPKVKEIQEKFKKDPRKMQMEVMNIYKKEGANPLMGCLPMLLQMPFLMGMFYLLKSTFPLRGASFIPGWINDLAAPDVLFSWGQPIWLLGNEFHLLPLLMAASMFFQQKMTSPTPPNTKDLSDQQKQQKMMGTILPLVMFVAFYSVPSGLNLYFIFSTMLGMGQQWWMTKQSKKTEVLDKPS